MIKNNKEGQLKFADDASIKWDKTITYKSKFNELKTLIKNTLDDVEKKEVEKNNANEDKKAEVQANMKAYRDYFNSWLESIEGKLNSEENEKDLVKSKINNASLRENYENIAYYQIKAFKLGKLWEKASQIIEEEEKAKTNKSEEERKEFEKQSQKLNDLFSSKEAINNLKEIQEEVNKLIKNEDEKFKNTPEDDFAFKMDDFLAKEKEINSKLEKEIEFKIKIASLNKSVEDNTIDKSEAEKQRQELDKQIKANVKAIEDLTKEYETLLKELTTLSSKIKLFEIYRNDFKFTVNAVDWISHYFKDFKNKYDNNNLGVDNSGTPVDYNKALTELNENTEDYFKQIANME